MIIFTSVFIALLIWITLHNLVIKKHRYAAEQKRLMTIHFIFLTLTAMMTQNVYDDGILVTFDIYFNNLMGAYYDPTLYAVMEWISVLTDIKGILVLTVILIPIFWYKKWYFEATFYLASFTGGALIAMAVKLAVERFRPPDHPLDVSLLSYPSGHAALTTVLAIYLYYIFYRSMEVSFARVMLLLSIVLLIIAGAISRVYMHAHWLSDTIASIFLEISWMSFLLFSTGLFLEYLSRGKRRGKLKQLGKFLTTGSRFGKR